MKVKLINKVTVLLAGIIMALSAQAEDGSAEKSNPMVNTTNVSEEKGDTENKWGESAENSSESLDKALTHGKLSKKDAEALKKDYNKIDQMKKDANQDGYMSNTEKALIKKEEDKFASRVKKSMNQ